MTIVGKHAPKSFNGWYVGLNTDGANGEVGKAYFYTGGAPINTPVSATLPKYGWHLFHGVKSGNEARIYINGRLEGTAQAGSAASNDVHLLAGAIHDEGSIVPSYAGHFMDDLRIYDHAFSTAEVEALAPVPEPASVPLIVGGLALMSVWFRRATLLD